MMILVLDINILVSAFREDAADHAEMRAWLERAVEDPEPVGVTDAVLGGALRIVTNPRVFTIATPLGEALAQASDLRHHPGAVTLSPGQRHWEIFERLCRAADARGNLVADAQRAAIAIEHSATWVSKDRVFARFQELRWRHPLDMP